MDDTTSLNRAWWDERAKLHPQTPMYRPFIEGLHRGEPCLFDLERELVGDVSGKRLLHVPCHIGHDTLSWALLGAHVTGVDFSPPALATAAGLADDLKLDATWVEADATNLPATLRGFDLAVATYGAFGWMCDLDAWFAGLFRALVPGGQFVFVDGHPLSLSLEQRDGEYVIIEPVMGGGIAVDEQSGSYADPSVATVNNRHVGWCHGVGELVTALLKAGFVIEHLAEHDHIIWQAFPDMVEVDHGFQLPEPWHGKVPLMLSIRALKPVRQ